MLFLDQLAEEKISEAIARGEFENLPGRGKPLPDEPEMAHIPPELRMGYRLLRNAGYVPEEVLLLREIDQLVGQIEKCEGELVREASRRLQLALRQLETARGSGLMVMEGYFQKLAARLEGPKGLDNPTPKPAGAGQPRGDG